MVSAEDKARIVQAGKDYAKKSHCPKETRSHESIAFRIGALTEHMIARKNAIEEIKLIVWKHRHEDKVSIAQIIDEINKKLPVQ